MYVYGFESYQVNKLECLLLGRFNLVRIKLSPPISSFFYSSSIILPPSIYIETLDSFDLLFVIVLKLNYIPLHIVWPQ